MAGRVEFRAISSSAIPRSVRQNVKVGQILGYPAWRQVASGEHGRAEGWQEGYEEAEH
jgi:hypothetical protein